MLQSIIILIFGVAITGFMAICAALFGLIPNGEDKVHRIARIWAKMLLIVSRTRVKVVGAENIQFKKPYIFMANHQSDFDIFIVLGYIPGQFRWIAKKELFKIPVFGKAMRNAGYIDIDRDNREKAIKSLDIAAKKIREGKSVMTFPEGTRSKDGTVKPFKQGMFHLAIKSGVPIIPITIIGAGTIMPKRSLRINPGRVTMIIDKPIDVSGYTVENRAELIDKVRNMIVNRYNQGTPSQAVELSSSAENRSASREM